MGSERLESKPYPEWLPRLVDAQICSLMEKTAGIVLRRAEQAPDHDLEYATIWTDMCGSYQAVLAVRVEKRLLKRMTEHMMDGPVTDPDDITEYAREFINVLCGRTISEIYRQTHKPARFYPPHFVDGLYNDVFEQGPLTSVLFYQGDEGETVQLSLTLFNDLPDL